MLKYSLIFLMMLGVVNAFSQLPDSLLINKKSPFYMKQNKEATDKSLPYSFEDKNDNSTATDGVNSPLYLETPENIETKVVYDPETKSYYLMQKVGGFWYRRPRALSFEEYMQYDISQSKKKFWFNRARDERQQYQYRLLPGTKYEKEDLVQKIFGDGTLSFKARGSAEMRMGLRFTTTDNPTISEEYRKHTSFFFDPKFQASVTGSLGDILSLDINYDTEATFDFSNKTKIAYEGNEDDIIQKIEAGNVSMDIQNGLIRTGNDLFGVRTDLQFGKLDVSTVFSQQKGEMRTVNLDNGEQVVEYEIDAMDYDANRHFFLSKYFRDNYNKTAATLPVFNTDITILKVEVWITSRISNYDKNRELRNLVAFVDLGENADNVANTTFTQIGSFTAPSNETNSLYNLMNTTYQGARDIKSVGATLSGIPNFTSGSDYVKIEKARRLSDSEFTFHPKLGFLSLKRALRNNESVAVAYQYIKGGKTYKVGELTSTGPVAPKNLYLKLLKAPSSSPSLPTWDLMMKNVYSLGASNVDASNFTMEVAYRNDKSGSLPLNYIEAGDIAGEPLLKALGLDRLNSQLDGHPDGMFDFIEGTTFVADRGLIIFPVIEPFGEDLARVINDSSIASDYTFEEIYTKSKSNLVQYASKDKFQLMGTYAGGEGGEIDLGAYNMSQGSVRVYAGSRLLEEGYDYTVNYISGSVKIINPALLESAVPIRIKTQNNSTFDLATKTLLGTDMTYHFNDNAYLGATAMYYQEQPMYSKVTIGEESVSNFMWGLNAGYNTESDFLTRMINKLPFYSTNQKVSVDVRGEFAQLLPGHNSGDAYIDDFEGSRESIDLRAAHRWYLASTPGKQMSLFPEGDLNDNLANGFNRAKLSWFVIDPTFYRSNSPVDAKALSSPYVRRVLERELFPEKDQEVGTSLISSVLNLNFDPTERGQYNFDTKGVSGISAGVDAEGKLKKPETRWGGIMRDMTVTDFESANVMYVEFWLLDPFIDDSNSSGGDFYFDLGDISEDILKDSRKSFENGLPTSENDYQTENTKWGRVGTRQSVINAFDNNSIDQQDLGLDGFDDEAEKNFFSAYLQELSAIGATAYQKALNDPAGDDYQHFRSTIYDDTNSGVLARYANYNNLQGNSIADNSASSFSTAYSSYPDVEDTNKDNTLDESENYFQYRIPLSPKEMEVGKNYITDVRTINAVLADGTTSTENWYQFKIPLGEYETAFGDISDFSSIRFMRMFLRGFSKPVTLRFARLNLLRGSWRPYQYSLENGNEGNPITTTGTVFDISTVNLVENSTRQPVNYVMPPNTVREVDPTYGDGRKFNEQALELRVDNLKDGDARGVLKALRMDLRRYKRLMMDVHAEQVNNTLLSDNATTVFLRIGSDVTHNYYEYEIPLKLTAPGTYGNTSAERRKVWPDANRFDFKTALFTQLKLLRNQEQTSGGGIDYTTKFTRALSVLADDYEPEHAADKLSIIGNPNLYNVRTVMIGIRNPNDGGGIESVEVWVNELRASDFEENSGWAANVNMTTQLADLGALTFSGQMLTSGFGELENTMSQRATESVLHYDVAATVDLGKLLPEKARLQIPMNYTFSEHNETPEYSALNPDVKLDEALDNTKTEEEKDLIKKTSKTYIKTKSFSLTGVKVLPKEDAISRPWNLSNFSATYAHNETYERNPTKAHNYEENYKAALTYDYSPKLKPFQPFKNSHFLSTKSYRFLKDFNIYYLPSRISLRSEMNRYFRSIVRRNLVNSNFITLPTFDSDFLWNRYYDIDYPITKSLKMSISAVNMSRVEEDYMRDENDLYDVWKGVVWSNFRKGGRSVNYNHRVNVEYQLPLNKISFLDWIKATAGYRAEYQWEAGPNLGDANLYVGNRINNQRILRFDGNVDLVQLYNKSNYLKALNQEKQGRKVLRGKTERKTYVQNIEVFKPNRGKLITHNLGTRAVSLKVTDENGKKVRASKKIVNDNRVRVTVYDTIVNAKIQLVGTVAQKRPVMNRVGEGFLKVLMGIRNIKVEYDRTQGSSLSGFLEEPSYFGLTDFSFNGAPGLGYVLGKQSTGILADFEAKNYLLRDNIVTDPYLMTKQERFTLRSTIEPINSLRITLNANREYYDNNSQFYSFDDNGRFEMGERYRTGNLSMSYLSLKSSFFKINDKSTYQSKYFNKFLSSRKGLSEQLAKGHYGDSYASRLNSETGYYEGYGETSQRVLVGAFQEAYGGKNKGLLPSIAKVMPNWKITYSGLNNVSSMQRIFKRINLEHAYQSRYSVGGYTSNLEYENGIDNFDMNGNLLNEIDISTLTIDERFSPLIGVNMEWQNNLTTNVSINRSHLLQLNVGSASLNETASNEWVFDFGYRFEDVNIFLGRRAKNRKFKNDLRILAGFTLRKDYTILRELYDGESEITSGQDSFLYNLAVDYALSDRLNLRFFYDRTVRNPYVSNSYPTITSNIGMSVRFNFTNFEKEYQAFGKKKKRKQRNVKKKE